jgi:hypothetical protein
MKVPFVFPLLSLITIFCLSTQAMSQSTGTDPIDDILVEELDTLNQLPEGDTIAPTESPQLLEAPETDASETEEETLEKKDLEIPEPLSLEAETAQIAEIRALDKLTGRLSTFEVALQRTYQYERLKIVLNSCQIFPKRKDSAMFVEIRDDKITDKPVFTGWMFSSSPALSAMDHPRYDVWLLSCKTTSGGSEPESVEKSAE